LVSILLDLVNLPIRLVRFSLDLLFPLIQPRDLFIQVAFDLRQVRLLRQATRQEERGQYPSQRPSRGEPDRDLLCWSYGTDRSHLRMSFSGTRPDTTSCGRR